MYCYHCGYEIDEHKIEAKGSSLEKHQDEINEETTVSYVCPRCGHLIHEGHTEQDIKSLSAASHVEIQRGNNSYAMGMGGTVLGTICLILAVVFFRLSYKPGLQNQLVVNCPEFYVSIILAVASVALLGYGITNVVIGIRRKKKYQEVLNDIRRETFVQ